MLESDKRLLNKEGQEKSSEDPDGWADGADKAVPDGDGDKEGDLEVGTRTPGVATGQRIA